MEPTRPLPSPNPGTVEYWKAAREHRLALPRCLDCGKFHSYPRALCPHCRSANLEWKTVSGKGAVYSYTEVFRPPSKAFTAETPYIVAVIALDEGPHLMTRLVTKDNASVHIGQRVTVAFEDRDEEISLPVFKVEEPRA